MPVIGHTLAGWATALAFPPRDAATSRGVLSPFWTPSVIALAYLPDLASQAALLLGAAQPTPVTHSLVLAAAAVPFVTALLVAAAGLRVWPALMVSALCLVGHDLLDLLQNPDRRPFWPWARTEWVTRRVLLPADGVGEVALLGGALLAVIAWRRRPAAPPAASVARGQRLIATAVTGAIMLGALATHSLRARREAAFAEAQQRLARGDAPGALRRAAEAGRWPSTVKPGRSEYLQAEAQLALGNRAEAERLYRAAVLADPGYFWAAADRVLFYATGDEPVDERRRRVAPMRARLVEEFAGDPALASMLAKIDGRLGTGEQPAGAR